MSAPPQQSRAPFGAIIDGLRRLPDLRAALEALAMFIFVMIAGGVATQAGVLEIRPAIGRSDVLALSLSVFLVPALSEELVFRGWLRRGAPIGAVISMLAFVVWHPVQMWFGLPFGRPEFLDPGFLGLVALLGLICTLTRLRSGSVWPGVVIHWGTVVVWIALYSGAAPA